MRFAVNLEKTDNGYGAYSPDIPGVVACGDTEAETLALFRESVEVLFDLIRKEGGEFPVPKAIAATIEIEQVA